LATTCSTNLLSIDSTGKSLQLINVASCADNSTQTNNFPFTSLDTSSGIVATFDNTKQIIYRANNIYNTGIFSRSTISRIALILPNSSASLTEESLITNDSREWVQLYFLNNYLYGLAYTSSQLGLYVIDPTNHIVARITLLQNQQSEACVGPATNKSIVPSTSYYDPSTTRTSIMPVMKCGSTVVMYQLAFDTRTWTVASVGSFAQFSSNGVYPFTIVNTTSNARVNMIAVTSTLTSSLSIYIVNSFTSFSLVMTIPNFNPEMSAYDLQSFQAGSYQYFMNSYGYTRVPLTQSLFTFDQVIMRNESQPSTGIENSFFLTEWNPTVQSSYSIIYAPYEGGVLLPINGSMLALGQYSGLNVVAGAYQGVAVITKCSTSALCLNIPALPSTYQKPTYVSGTMTSITINGTITYPTTLSSSLIYYRNQVDSITLVGNALFITGVYFSTSTLACNFVYSTSTVVAAKYINGTSISCVIPTFGDFSGSVVVETTIDGTTWTNSQKSFVWTAITNSPSTYAPALSSLLDKSLQALNDATVLSSVGKVTSTPVSYNSKTLLMISSSFSSLSNSKERRVLGSLGTFNFTSRTSSLSFFIDDSTFVAEGNVIEIMLYSSNSFAVASLLIDEYQNEYLTVSVKDPTNTIHRDQTSCNFQSSIYNTLSFTIIYDSGNWVAQVVLISSLSKCTLSTQLPNFDTSFFAQKYANVISQSNLAYDTPSKRTITQSSTAPLVVLVSTISVSAGSDTATNGTSSSSTKSGLPDILGLPFTNFMWYVVTPVGSTLLLLFVIFIIVLIVVVVIVHKKKKEKMRVQAESIALAVEIRKKKEEDIKRRKIMVAAFEKELQVWKKRAQDKQKKTVVQRYTAPDTESDYDDDETLSTETTTETIDSGATDVTLEI
jgi:hypothetical protein